MTPIRFEGHERAADQAQDWHCKQQYEGDHHKDHECLLPALGRLAEGAPFRAERRFAITGCVDPVLQQRHKQGDAELDHREQAGHREVEAVHRLVVYFHFNRAELRTAEHQHYPKTGEIKQENQQGCAQQGG